MHFAFKSPVAVASGLAVCLLSASAMAGPKDSLTRTMIVQASPDTVWRLIGPFCAIGDWHPAIGSCALDGADHPTRTLVTRDGQAVFVELEVARNDSAHRYSYSFTSSPLPVSNYVATISVRANGRYGSVITWRGDYLPNPGQEGIAAQALAGIYETGLAAIRDRFNHPPEAER